MLPAEISDSLFSLFKKILHFDLQIISDSVLSGGSINQVLRLKTNRGYFCLKYNRNGSFPEMFKKEAMGLDILRNAGEIRVPLVIGTDDSGQYSYLLLEFITSAPVGAGFMAGFGHSLARLHRHTGEYFGLSHDNYMGSLQQSNRPNNNFPDFFIRERLAKQLDLAMKNDYLSKEELQKFDQLHEKLPGIIPAEKPSLIHGDLWNGNFIVSEEGRACLIDPAVYYGHREVDIAMSTLFGGFGPEFYSAYQESFPMEKGWKERLDIYNLYPLLVHLNLFGSGYLGEIRRIIRKF